MLQTVSTGRQDDRRNPLTAKLHCGYMEAVRGDLDPGRREEDP